MSTPPAFAVTPEALEAIRRLLQNHPEMQAGLFMMSGFDVGDEQGVIEASVEGESFWMAYDSPDTFAQWPRVELGGQSLPIAPDALKRLTGKTLTLGTLDQVFADRKFLVVV